MTQKETPATATLELHPVVRPEDVERQYARLSMAGGIPRRLVIDLRPSVFIDLPALPSMISIAAARSKVKQITQFTLPDLKRTQDFLKLWRFFEALSDASGEPLDRFLGPGDVNKLAEPIETYPHHPRGIDALEFNPMWTSGAIGQRNFFEFLSFKLSGPDAASGRAPLTIPRTEAGRWQGELIKAVLRTHLSAGEEEQDEVARVIVFEALANSVQHPAAGLIQIVSGFQRADPYISEAQERRLFRREDTYVPPQPDGPRGTITICVWDNGTSIVQTLASVLKAGGRVRKFRLPVAMYDKYLLATSNIDDQPLGDALPVDSADDPTSTSADELLLLASTFPGVTRRLRDSVPVVENIASTENGVERPLESQFGMGLYILVRSAVVRHLGSVTLRCGRTLINIKLSYDAIRKPYGVQYKASAWRFPQEAPEFFGNLLTVRLPIRRGKDLST